MDLKLVLPPIPDLLQLEPEEIAPLLLRCLKDGEDQYLLRTNFMNGNGPLGKYAGDRFAQVSRVLAEGWVVLEREGLIAPNPEDHIGWVFITRRGLDLLKSGDFKGYFLGHLLPPRSLHPVLETKVRHTFLRGDYDTSVFAAFRELEIRVRAAAGLGDDEIGVPLMRKAFDPQNGALTDKTKVIGEREATSHLFAGAVGLFKNPSSHRSVAFKPEEAADLIRFANYLINWLSRIKP